MLLDKSFVCWRISATRLALVQRCLTGLSRPPTRTIISARLADAFRCWKTSWLKTPFSSTRILRSLKLNGLALSFLAAPLIRQIECKRKVSGELSRRADELAKKTREEPEVDLTLEDIWSLLKPHFGWLIAAVVAAIATAVLNIQLPLLLGELIDAMAEIIKEKALLGAASLAHLRPIGTKIATIYIAQAVLTFLYIAFLTVLGERMAVEMRLRLFSRLLSQDAAFYDVNKTAELGARLNTDVQEFKSCFKLTVSQGLRTFAQTGGCVVSLYTISARMTLMTMAFLPVVIIAGTICGAFLRSMSRQAQAQSAIAASVSDEALGNIRTVKSFAMEEHEKRLFAREVEKAAEQQELLGAGIGLFQGGSNLFLNGIVLSVLYGGSSLIASGELSPGDLMSFLVTAQTIQRSLSQLSIVFGHAVKGWTAGARVFQFVNIPPGLEAGSGGRIPYHSLFGDIHFENVSFSYPSRPGHNVLENLDLKISGGQVVALCGPSGEGKSTLTALLERFYEPTLGRITIDGQDIRDLDVGWLRGSAIGLISQEPVLFMTSIEENIRYGKPSATDEEVRQAARLANAEEFIQRFPQGYKTIVGERGAQLSGGQKQRVAIARALLKNPPILILDEATSALDAESEKLVREALDTASRGRTVLVIAHRLSTIQNSDKIAVIRGRRVAEEGQHEDLMTKRGIYYNLVKSQYQT